MEREAAEKEEKIDMDSKVQKKDEYLVSAFNQSQNSDENQKLIIIIQGGIIGGSIIFEVMRSVKKIKKSRKKKK